MHGPDTVTSCIANWAILLQGHVGQETRTEQPLLRRGLSPPVAGGSRQEKQKASSDTWVAHLWDCPLLVRVCVGHRVFNALEVVGVWRLDPNP